MPGEEKHLPCWVLPRYLQARSLIMVDLLCPVRALRGLSRFVVNHSRLGTEQRGFKSCLGPVILCKGPSLVDWKLFWRAQVQASWEAPDPAGHLAPGQFNEWWDPGMELWPNLCEESGELHSVIHPPDSKCRGSHTSQRDRGPSAWSSNLQGWVAWGMNLGVGVCSTNLCSAAGGTASTVSNKSQPSFPCCLLGWRQSYRKGLAWGRRRWDTCHGLTLS